MVWTQAATPYELMRWCYGQGTHDPSPLKTYYAFVRARRISYNLHSGVGLLSVLGACRELAPCTVSRIGRAREAPRCVCLCQPLPLTLDDARHTSQRRCTQQLINN